MTGCAGDQARKDSLCLGVWAHKQVCVYIHWGLASLTLRVCTQLLPEGTLLRAHTRHLCMCVCVCVSSDTVVWQALGLPAHTHTGMCGPPPNTSLTS